MQFTLVDAALAPFFLRLWTQSTGSNHQQSCRKAAIVSKLQFTLVDVALAPFLLRLPMLKHYRGFELPPVCTFKCWTVTVGF